MSWGSAGTEDTGGTNSGIVDRQDYAAQCARALHVDTKIDAVIRILDGRKCSTTRVFHFEVMSVAPEAVSSMALVKGHTYQIGRRTLQMESDCELR